MQQRQQHRNKGLPKSAYTHTPDPTLISPTWESSRSAYQSLIPYMDQMVNVGANSNSSLSSTPMVITDGLSTATTTTSGSTSSSPTHCSSMMPPMGAHPLRLILATATTNYIPLSSVSHTTTSSSASPTVSSSSSTSSGTQSARRPHRSIVKTQPSTKDDHSMPAVSSSSSRSRQQQKQMDKTNVTATFDEKQQEKTPSSSPSSSPRHRKRMSSGTMPTILQSATTPSRPVVATGGPKDDGASFASTLRSLAPIDTPLPLSESSTLAASPMPIRTRPTTDYDGVASSSPSTSSSLARSGRRSRHRHSATTATTTNIIGGAATSSTSSILGGGSSSGDESTIRGWSNRSPSDLHRRLETYHDDLPHQPSFGGGVTTPQQQHHASRISSASGARPQIGQRHPLRSRPAITRVRGSIMPTEDQPPPTGLLLSSQSSPPGSSTQLRRLPPQQTKSSTATQATPLLRHAAARHAPSPTSSSLIGGRRTTSRSPTRNTQSPSSTLTAPSSSTTTYVPSIVVTSSERISSRPSSAVRDGDTDDNASIITTIVTDEKSQITVDRQSLAGPSHHNKTNTLALSSGGPLSLGVPVPRGGATNARNRPTTPRALQAGHGLSKADLDAELEKAEADLGSFVRSNIKRADDIDRRAADAAKQRQLLLQMASVRDKEEDARKKQLLLQQLARARNRRVDRWEDEETAQKLEDDIRAKLREIEDKERAELRLAEEMEERRLKKLADEKLAADRLAAMPPARSRTSLDATNNIDGTTIVIDGAKIADGPSSPSSPEGSNGLTSLQTAAARLASSNGLDDDDDEKWPGEEDHETAEPDDEPLASIPTTGTPPSEPTGPLVGFTVSVEEAVESEEDRLRRLEEEERTRWSLTAPQLLVTKSEVRRAVGLRSMNETMMHAMGVVKTALSSPPQSTTATTSTTPPRGPHSHPIHPPHDNTIPPPLHIAKGRTHNPPATRAQNHVIHHHPHLTRSSSPPSSTRPRLPPSSTTISSMTTVAQNNDNDTSTISTALVTTSTAVTTVTSGPTSLTTDPSSSDQNTTSTDECNCVVPINGAPLITCSHDRCRLRYHMERSRKQRDTEEFYNKWISKVAYITSSPAAIAAAAAAAQSSIMSSPVRASSSLISTTHNMAVGGHTAFGTNVPNTTTAITVRSTSPDYGNFPDPAAIIEKNHQLRRQLHSLREQRDTIAAKLEFTTISLRNEMEPLRQELDRLKHENAKLVHASRWPAKEAKEISRLTGDMERMQSRYKSQLSILQGELHDAQRARLKAEAAANEANQRAGDTAARQRAAAASFASGEAQLESLTREIERRRDEAERSERARGALEHQLRASQAAHAECSNKEALARQVTEQLVTLQKAHMACDEQKRTMTTEINQLKGHLTRERQDTDDMHDQLTSRVHQLESDLKNAIDVHQGCADLTERVKKHLQEVQEKNQVRDLMDNIVRPMIVLMFTCCG
jgi:ribosomal protein S15P/S13E